MSNEKLEEYLRVVEPKFNSHLEKGTIEMSIEYYTLLEERIRRLIDENESLKKQLEYLRSGKYYNQLRFENEMLQQVVDTNGAPSEVYDFLESVHKNTEFLEQRQEFIKYLEKEIVDCKAGSGQQYYAQEHLKMFKEIIGTDTNVGSKGGNKDE